MKKGCLIAFVVVTGVVILAVVGIVFALDSIFNLFTPKARVDLAERYGADRAIVLRIDPNHMSFKTMASEMAMQDPVLFDWIMPYEGAMFIDADVETMERWMTFAVSTRRLAGFFSYTLPLTKEGRMPGGFVGGAISVGDDGVIVMDADGPISPEAIDEMNRRWPERTNERISIEGGHAVEFIFNNADGQAYLALEQWLMESVKKAEEEARARGEEVVFDQENLSTLFYQVKTGRITMDLIERDHLEVVVDMHCPETMAAGAVLVSSNIMIDRLREALAEDGTILEGELQKEDERVFGTLIVTGFDQRLVDAGQDVMIEFQQGDVQRIDELPVEDPVVIEETVEEAPIVIEETVEVEAPAEPEPATP